MKLADRVAHCRAALTVQDPATGRVVELSGAASCAPLVSACPLRFVLSDDLTGLCTELALSRGARHLACADLLRVPAEVLWVEWCHAPWQGALERCGFSRLAVGAACGGRRGVLVEAARDGRRGVIRTFWSEGGESGALASSMEACFDFDTEEGEEPAYRQGLPGAGIRVYDGARQNDDLLSRCFRFHYEQSWAAYYRSARLSPLERAAVTRHVLGTIALDIPVLLAFLLLLGSRSSLPRHPRSFAQLNCSRRESGKAPLLDHIDVSAPLLPEYLGSKRLNQHTDRRSPRLHHVRGHLVRRGSTLFWRVPHLRGSARSGCVRARTVTWTFGDKAPLSSSLSR